MVESSSTDKDSAPPEYMIPRYWWLKRLLVAFVVLLVCIGCLRWYWGYRANSILQARIDAIRSTGEPLLLADFEIDPIADAENAAFYYRQALRVYMVPPEGDPGEGEPVGVADTAAYLADNEEFFQLVRMARQFDQADWKINLVSPALTILLPHLGESRRIAKILSHAVNIQFERQNHSEALELILDMLHLSDMVEQPPTNLINHLVSISIRSMAVQALQRYILNLGLPETRPAIETIIGVLLREDVYRQGYLNAFVADRGALIDFGQTFITEAMRWDMIYFNPTYVLINVAPEAYYPQMVLESHHALELFDRMLEYVRSTHNAQSVSGKINDMIDTNVDKYGDRFPLTYQYIPLFDTDSVRYYRHLTRMRLAAAALAIRLYEQDHGQMPQTLEQLVPDYLPAVPIDAMSKDRLIQYLPEGAQPILLSGEKLDRAVPVLYSVDLNFLDDGGHFLLDTDGYPDTSESDDMVFLLEGPIDMPESETNEP